MTVSLLRGDALALPLPAASVDLVVTSPPYFGLRSYQDDGEHYAGQLGSEATPTEFVDALIAATREMIRVLKPSGSIWVNLGDKYAERTGPIRPGGVDDDDRIRRRATRPARGRRGSIPVKSLLGIPWRYAIRCVDELELIHRAEVIWDKPNGLPESVTDRVRRSHEQWFHFTVRPRYFAAVDEIRDQPSGYHREPVQIPEIPGQRVRAMLHTSNPLGKLPGSVWSVPTQPLTVPAELGVDHFAAFPMEWPRRIIRGWSPAEVCTSCGQGRRPVTAPTGDVGRVPGGGGTYARMRADGTKDTNLAAAALRLRSITGYACDCASPSAPTRPGVVLDPFGGTGTTALVAHALGRHGISVDRSADYCRLAQWRTTDRRQLAAALQVDRPDPVAPDQIELFA